MTGEICDACADEIEDPQFVYECDKCGAPVCPSCVDYVYNDQGVELDVCPRCARELGVPADP